MEEREQQGGDADRGGHAPPHGEQLEEQAPEQDLLAHGRQEDATEQQQRQIGERRVARERFDGLFQQRPPRIAVGHALDDDLLDRAAEQLQRDRRRPRHEIVAPVRRAEEEGLVEPQFQHQGHEHRREQDGTDLVGDDQHPEVESAHRAGDRHEQVESQRQQEERERGPAR